MILLSDCYNQKQFGKKKKFNVLPKLIHVKIFFFHIIMCEHLIILCVIGVLI